MSGVVAPEGAAAAAAAVVSNAAAEAVDEEMPSPPESGEYLPAARPDACGAAFCAPKLRALFLPPR